MVSVAEFLTAGFLNASCAALAAVFTPCDLAILLNRSGRDAKYLDTGSRHKHVRPGLRDQRIPELVQKAKECVFLVRG